jgi:hypothetical protein
MTPAQQSRPFHDGSQAHLPAIPSHAPWPPHGLPTSQVGHGSTGVAQSIPAHDG